MQFVTFNAKEIIETASVGVQIKQLQDDEPIKQAFRYIFTLIGLKAENIPSDIQKAVLINFVKNELGMFTPEEITLAFRLAVSKKLDVDVSHYQNFNAIYLADVLEAYRQRRNSAMTEFRRQLKQIQQDSEIEISPERKRLLFWEFVDTIVLKVWDDFVRTGRIDFQTYRIKSIFDAIETEFGFMALTLEKKIEIKKRAEVIAKSELNQPCETLEKIREIRAMKEAIDAGMNHIGFEDVVIRKCREIAIRDFFSTLKSEGRDLRSMFNAERQKERK
jgi:hypothetical protein